VKFKCVCKVCGAALWIRGTHEGDTNATELDINDPEWDEACEHLKDGADYDITDSEPIDRED
jgi:hypothetical protein